MDKQLNLLYFSPTDTTAKIVKAIGEGIAQNCITYNLTPPAEREKPVQFEEHDLVIVGVPVYAGRIPNFLTDYFSQVKGHNTPTVFVVVYGGRHYDDALLELKTIFENHGFIAIAGCAFIGEHSYTNQVAAGRPDRKDLQAAKALGEEISRKLTKLKSINDVPKLTVKGSFPYKKFV